MEAIWTIPDYASMSLFDYGWNGLWGLFGALAFGTAANTVIELPSRANGGWRLNAAGEWASGIFIGMLANTSPLHAFIAGGLAPLIIGYVIYRGTKVLRPPNDDG